MKREGENERLNSRAARPLSAACGPLLLLFSLLLPGAACQPNASILNSKPASEAPAGGAAPGAGGANSFESDLKSMETADFDYVYVFRRKDGARLDADDKRFAKASSPAETNRFILSDEERAIIAGSKYKFTPGHLKTLGTRFEIADYSKPGANPQDANSAAKANAGG